MRAINIQSNKEYEVHEPDKYTDKIMPCDYWLETGGHVLLLVEYPYKVERGQEYRTYKIGDKLYQGTWTSSYEELKK